MTSLPQVVRPQGGGRQPRPLRERFDERVDRSGGPDACWPWTGLRNKRGYGRIGLGGRGTKVVLAHRLAWQFANGEIPEGAEIMHSCDNPPCCNHAHLSDGSHADNMADMASKGRVRKPGTGPRGTRHHAAKLTPALVAAARAAVADGETTTDVARQLGVARSTIARAVSGRNWRCSAD